MKYFTREDSYDLTLAFDMCSKMEGRVHVAEVYNPDLLDLTEEQIKKEMKKVGIYFPEDELIIIKGDGYIELLLER